MKLILRIALLAAAMFIVPPACAQDDRAEAALQKVEELRVDIEGLQADLRAAEAREQQLTAQINQIIADSAAKLSAKDDQIAALISERAALTAEIVELQDRIDELESNPKPVTPKYRVYICQDRDNGIGAAPNGVGVPLEILDHFQSIGMHEMVFLGDKQFRADESSVQLRTRSAIESRIAGRIGPDEEVAVCLNTEKPFLRHIEDDALRPAAIASLTTAHRYLTEFRPLCDVWWYTMPAEVIYRDSHGRKYEVTAWDDYVVTAADRELYGLQFDTVREWSIAMTRRNLGSYLDELQNIGISCYGMWPDVSDATRYFSRREIARVHLKADVCESLADGRPVGVFVYYNTRDDTLQSVEEFVRDGAGAALAAGATVIIFYVEMDDWRGREFEVIPYGEALIDLVNEYNELDAARAVTPN